MKKDVEITGLARRMMARRGISEAWVTDALAWSEKVVEGYGGRAVACQWHKVGGKDRMLRVVFEETTEKFTVVTAYLTSSLKGNRLRSPMKNRAFGLSTRFFRATKIASEKSTRTISLHFWLK